MNWRDMPSLSTLRAFHAFANSAGVTEAGALINVSHAAISQQLRALERHLGVPLLDRSGRSMTLTAEGHILAQSLTLGFGAIHSAVQDISSRSAQRPLHITCSPMFATYWLMPRLSTFREAYPDIDLVIDPTGKVVPLAAGGADLALRYGYGTWDGLETEILLSTPIVVVAAPDLLSTRTISQPEDLIDLPWLEEIGTNEASVWLHSRGVDKTIKAGRVYLPGNLMMEALRAGQGVAVAVRDFVAPDVKEGRLVELFCEPAGRAYYIAYRPGPQRQSLQDFIAWLRRERDMA